MTKYTSCRRRVDDRRKIMGMMYRDVLFSAARDKNATKRVVGSYFGFDQIKSDYKMCQDNIAENRNAVAMNGEIYCHMHR